MILPNRVCAVCGTDDLIIVAPGSDPVYGGAADLLGRPDPRMPAVLLNAGTPAVAYCMRCWQGLPDLVLAREDDRHE